MLSDKLGIKLFEDLSEHMNTGRFTDDTTSLTSILIYYIVFFSSFVTAKMYYFLFNTSKSLKNERHRYLWNAWLIFITINLTIEEIIHALNFKWYLRLPIELFLLLITIKIALKFNEINKARLYDKYNTNN